jgi:hypothetical protein
MPTQEEWLDKQILSTVWTAPLISSELSLCFAELVKQIQTSQEVVHILFDITMSGGIPAQAPMHFIRSQIAMQTNLGSMAVIGTNPIAQILAQTAVKMTGQNILFFDSEKDALDYLKSS